MTIKKLFLFSILLFTTACANASITQANLQQLANQYLTEHSKDEHISAVAITIQNPRNQTISAYAGHTSYDGEKPLNANNLFHIGSITKSFTSALILQLEDDASLKFSIDDRIEKYFPHLKKWQGVTIRQLMNMTSGIPDYSESEDFAADFKSNPYRYRMPDELIHFAYRLKTHYAPGTQYNYSNTNYLLLGLLIERLTGNSYAYELKSRLIRPLKLNHTYYSDDRYAGRIYRHIVRSYIFKNDINDSIPKGTDATDFTMSVYGASGAMIANTADIVMWVNGLYTPGKILTKAQIQKLTQTISVKTGQALEVPTKDDPIAFGLGIICNYIAETGEIAYSYEGMTLAGRAIYLYLPARNWIISATVNSSVDGSMENKDHLNELMMQIYRIL